MLYALKVHSVICQLCPNETGGKSVNFFKDYIFFLRESKRASRGREGEADSPMDPRTPGS